MFFSYYTTFQYSTIKDRNLGLYYYTGILAVVFYSVVTIFINKGYLHIDHSPQGSVTLISDSLDQNITLHSDTSYCCQNASCKIKCFLIDGKELAWPLNTDSVTISTFFKEREQSISPDLEVTVSTGEKQYFSKNPEAVDIKVEHSVHSRSISIAGTQRTLQGTLKAYNGTVLKVFNSYDKADRLSLHDLILASDIGSLDKISDSPNGNNKSFRRKGCVLVVTIFYQNTLSILGTSLLTYTYTVKRVPLMPHRVEETIPINLLPLDPERRYSTQIHRLLRKRYGVHIKFLQGGEIGKFSFLQLLQCLATSVGLVSLVSGLGDVIALNLIPNSKIYKDRIYGMNDILDLDTKFVKAE